MILGWRKSSSDLYLILILPGHHVPGSKALQLASDAPRFRLHPACSRCRKSLKGFMASACCRLKSTWVGWFGLGLDGR